MKKQIKLYAKQVNPAHQDCDYLWREIIDENLNKIIIAGNRGYKGVTIEEYDVLIKHLDEINYYLTPEGELVDDCYYDSFEEFVNDMFYISSKNKYSQAELTKWKELFVDILTDKVEINNHTICRGLFIMTGKEYNYWTIRGCCQSEWNTLYAPIGTNADYYEKIYFDLGTEWRLSYNADFKDCWYYYSLENDEDKIREDLASNEGCEADEVKMYKWVNQHYVDDYKEV